MLGERISKQTGHRIMNAIQEIYWKLPVGEDPEITGRIGNGEEVNQIFTDKDSTEKGMGFVTLSILTRRGYQRVYLEEKRFGVELRVEDPDQTPRRMSGRDAIASADRIIVHARQLLPRQE